MAKTEIIDGQNRVKIKKINLKRLAQNLARALNINSVVSIVIVDSNEIRRVNREFLKRDRPTNVISFVYGLSDLFGEVIVSIDAALSEARKFGQTPEQHLAYLVLHGLLHLAGYHHEPKGAAAKEARKLQEELFKSDIVPFLKENPIF